MLEINLALKELSMLLNVAVDGVNVDINVPDSMLSEARDFF